MESARPARPGDLDTIVALARRQRAEAEDARGGPLWIARHARAEPLDGAYRGLLTRDGATLVAGCLDDVVVGFGAVEIDAPPGGPKLGVVTDLYVEPEAREVGVGEAILDRLVAFSARQGCEGVDSLALPGERATKNFFETSGFVARALVMHRRVEPGDADRWEVER